MKKIPLVNGKLHCNSCSQDKDLSEFYKFKRPCKQCKLEYSSTRYFKNKPKQSQQDSKEKRQKLKELRKLYPSYKEYKSAYMKLYRSKNKQIISKRKLKPLTKIKRILHFSKLKPNFTPQQLFSHLESLFESWMNWDNWTTYNPKTWDDNNSSTWTWNIDHIIPKSDLPYNSQEDDNFKKCWALTNLRPYSAKQNILDGATKIRHKDKNGK